jgi:hypothetical protein
MREQVRGKDLLSSCFIADAYSFMLKLKFRGHHVYFNTSTIDNLVRRPRNSGVKFLQCPGGVVAHKSV